MDPRHASVTRLRQCIRTNFWLRCRLLLILFMTFCSTTVRRYLNGWHAEVLSKCAASTSLAISFPLLPMPQLLHQLPLKTPYTYAFVRFFHCSVSYSTAITTKIPMYLIWTVVCQLWRLRPLPLTNEAYLRFHLHLYLELSYTYQGPHINHISVLSAAWTGGWL